MKNYPSHTLFSVSQGDSQEAADWTPIGVAFTNKDGSLSVMFDEGKAPAPEARLILRKRKPRAVAQAEQGGQP